MRPFLHARWLDLAVLNYAIDPRLLAPYVPGGTELDLWRRRAYVSLVGFRFRDTRVLGLPIPFHRHFEEVNLRLYVRRPASDGWRRGVVFVKEIVPRAAIAFTARVLYNENYVALPMSHRVEGRDGSTAPLRSVAYHWRSEGRGLGLEIAVTGAPTIPAAGSEEEFVIEHYWEYTAQRDGGTVEYQVEHPPWRVAAASNARLLGDVAGYYGSPFDEALRKAPVSSFLAEGSRVVVYKGRRLP